MRAAFAVIVIVAVNLAACGGDGSDGGAVPSPAPSASLTEVATPTATPSPSATAIPTATEAPTEQPTPAFTPAPVATLGEEDGVHVLPPTEGFSQVPPQPERARYDASEAGVGVPVILDVPAGWRLFYGDRIVAAAPLDVTTKGLAAVSRPAGGLASAQDAFAAALQEAGGGYELLEEFGPAQLPEGFEAGGRTRATRSFEIGELPQNLLSQWLAAEGAISYWAIALVDDRVILAVIESPDPTEQALIEDVFRGFRLVR